MIFTTPVVTLVVVLVLAPEIVVKPAPEVMGVKLKVPAPKLETVPGSTILPLPAFRVVLAPRITPVLESPRVMRVLVVATVPLIKTEEGVVTLRPPVKVNVSPPSPKVTAPLLRKSTSATKVLPVPVMEMVVAVAAVIKSLTVTAPVNAADAPLVMVKLLMLRDVPVMPPPVPAFKPKLKAPLLPALKVMFAPAVEPPPVLPTVLFAVKETAAKLMASPDVETLVFRIAALATVNALLNKDAAVAKVTPVPPAVNVVIPVMVPPPETAFTVIVPAPAAVMFKDPAAVMKSSSALLRFNPPVALPKDTFTPELLVIPIAPVTFIAAPIETSPALEIVSAESCAEFPTVPVKVTVPAPAVRPRVCAPLRVLLKSMLLLVVSRATLAPRVTAPV